jgi:alkylation response protein AidB-like acyl-CoA dehydrogenase
MTCIMDPETTDDQRMLLDSVDRLIARHLPPDEVRRRDAEADPPDHLLPLMGGMGLLGLPVPASLGGAGGDWRTMAAVQERLGWHATMAAILFNRVTCFGIMTLLASGTEAQKAAFLPGLMAGQGAFALALTEPGAGSDAGALATRAKPVPGGWQITGRKVWISGAAQATRMVVACRTGDAARGTRGVTMLLVPPDAPGIHMTRLEKVGNRCSLSYDIGLDGVFVPQDAVLGTPGEGFEVLRRTLFHARSGLAAAVVGTAQRAVDMAAGHARARIQFGRPIGANQAIAHRLARMQTEVDMARLAARALAASIDAGAPCARLAAQAKWAATETLKRVTEDGMQIMASVAYEAGHDMNRMWRDARLYTFGEGSSEILLDMIARDMGLGGAL